MRVYKSKEKERLGTQNINNQGFSMKIVEYRKARSIDVMFEDGLIVYNREYKEFKEGTIRKPICKVGETKISNEGYLITIIRYVNSSNIDVQFEDGTVVKSVYYSNFTAGSVRKPVNRVGEKYITNEGYEIEIIEYFNYKNCTTRFKSGFILKDVMYGNIITGSVSNPYHPSVFGVGYIGVGVHKTSYKGNKEVLYDKWYKMLERAYCLKYKEKHPTYKNVTVCEEWHNFQNFAEWYYSNYNSDYMKWWELDKDILIRGNKIYSPETCCFVPQEINKLLSKPSKCRKYPTGVHLSFGKYQAVCGMGKKQKSLGTFDTPEEAFQAYKIAKEDYIKEVANKWRYLINTKVYEILMNYEIEMDI